VVVRRGVEIDRLGKDSDDRGFSIVDVLEPRVESVAGVLLLGKEERVEDGLRLEGGSTE